MISDARTQLGGLWLIRRDEQIVARVGDKKLGQNEQLLTFSPLTISGVDYLARLPEATCYGVSFDTYFNWTEPDRRGATTPATELVFDVASAGGESEPGPLPGVIVR